MKVRWPRAVLFDFDGVIVNSEPLHMRAFQEVLAREHVELSEKEYFEELIGFDDKGAFRRVFEKRGLRLTPGTLLRLVAGKSEVMMDMIHRHPREFHALPGVEEFVRGLWRHRPLAICSGALREEIEAMLEGVALRDCFPIIVAAEDVTVGKPDPQGYILAARLVSERLKLKKPLEPADCLVVEDAPSVIHSVKAAGFPVLAVATSYFPDRLAEADYVVRTLKPDEVRKQIPGLPLTEGPVVEKEKR
jgi:beta-phosphoglucomutase